MGSGSGGAVQLAVLGCAFVAAIVLGALLLRRRPVASPVAAPTPVGTGPDPRRPRAAVVLNPTKVADVDAARAWLDAGCAAAGWAPPGWLLTTVEDPGLGQARAAVADGVDVVIAWGGDGTVRAVTEAVAGSGVPLGLLPAGTGNLLARNLAVPLSDLDAALAMALGPAVREIDVALAEIDVSGEDRDLVPMPFLVMAGLGFDAEVMAAVEPRLKERVGWWAYVVAGAQNLRGRDTRVRIGLDGRTPLRRRVRSVIIGNCGELTGGVRLMPAAEVDDGWLDLVVVSPRNVAGWAAVIASVLTLSRFGHPVVEHFRCREVEVRPERPLQVQLDGDPGGLARALRVRVDPGSLLVKAPHGRAPRVTE